MALTIQFLSEASFDALRDEWNALLSRSRSDSVFLRWEWIHTWWELFKADRRLFIVEARQDRRLVGIAPLYVDSSGPFGARTLRLCGDETGSDYLDIFVDRGGEKPILEALLAWVRGASGWDVAALDDLRNDALLLSHPAALSDWDPSVQASHTCPYVAIQGTFDEYFQSRRDLRRFNLIKKETALLGKLGVERRRVSLESEVVPAMDDLFQLHAKRAHAKHLRTNFQSDIVKRFHRRVGRLFLAEGILNLQLLYHDRKPICAHYCLDYRGRTNYFQSGFDPEWGRYSVSMVLLRQIIRDAFQAGQAAFDFLKGNEAYKMMWANATCQESQIHAYNRTWRGLSSEHLARLKPTLRYAKRALLEALHVEPAPDPSLEADA
jgi:CelD/BcsL family acetyltransferase involved in cellulose biosynthesis